MVASAAKRRFYRALRYGNSGSSVDSIMRSEEESDERSSISSGRRKSSLASGNLAGSSEANTLAAADCTERNSSYYGDDEKSLRLGKGVLDNVLPPEEIENYKAKAKWYASMCLGTTAILSVFAFLFAIPFVVEPAISTILADFSAEAVTCATTSHILAEGLKNCSWSSCREGTYYPISLMTMIILQGFGHYIIYFTQTCFFYLSQAARPR